jgi:hypothetical protein
MPFGVVLYTAQGLRHHIAKVCRSPYFGPREMRFFRSRLARKVWPAPGLNATYFVTSEQFVGSGGAAPRRYTVRVLMGCKINTVGEFQQYKTAAAAHKVARDRARGWGEHPAPGRGS